MEKLFELWGGRSPRWELKYEKMITQFADYGKGTNALSEDKSKIFGAGYEMYIVAFFIGLYFDRQKPLNQDKAKSKDFGWAIQNWGNIERRSGRSPYGKIREYMFAALIAKTDIDFIELDKGHITPRKAVDALIRTMEDYANYGFDYMQEQLEENPNCFYKEGGFLNMFLPFVKEKLDATPESDAVSRDAIGMTEVPSTNKRARIGSKIEPYHKEDAPDSL
ncbi:MAG: glycoside hydrolase family 15 [Bacteroidaceae bacterium]|nr:glycoside hydrolase family 15 [Bacteroidaceae bacterium]